MFHYNRCCLPLPAISTERLRNEYRIHFRFIFQHWKWPAHAENRHCANCIGTPSFPISLRRSHSQKVEASPRRVTRPDPVSTSDQWTVNWRILQFNCPAAWLGRAANCYGRAKWLAKPTPNPLNRARASRTEPASAAAVSALSCSIYAPRTRLDRVDGDGRTDRGTQGGSEHGRNHWGSGVGTPEIQTDPQTFYLAFCGVWWG